MPAPSDKIPSTLTKACQKVQQDDASSQIMGLEIITDSGQKTKLTRQQIKELFRECVTEANNGQNQKIAFTPDDIERKYGIPVGSLANMRCKRIGPPYFKVNRKIFYKPVLFENWFYGTPVLTKDSITEDLNR
ncbi:MAG: hypothetical protein CVU54_14375 [Deltaproteobacteria bacterium HGW-Deltaproteobacteria-12]|jgi:hypothetical protein|nr:MAG: hypothetical protein CVU54_14375 [Deltaproteobacteria bacterium HGW-Deltaproteobacteria-12]